MSWQAIQTLLDTQVATVADLPTLITENMFTEKTITTTLAAQKTAYTRTSLLPSETEPFTLGTAGEDRYQGLYQVSLFYPEGDLVEGSNVMADRIIAKYTRSTLLTDGSVTVRIWRSWREIGIQSSFWYHLPVTVRWSSEIS